MISPSETGWEKTRPPASLPQMTEVFQGCLKLPQVELLDDKRRCVSLLPFCIFSLKKTVFLC